MITLRRSARPGSPATTVEPPTLMRFVLLSMLLHVLVIVVFGTAPGGGARRDGGSWGSLDVTLRPLSREPGSGFRLAPGAETSSQSAALLRRLGGAARSPPPRAADPPATPMPTATPAEPPAVTSPSAVTPAPAAPVAPEAPVASPVEQPAPIPEAARPTLDAATPSQPPAFEALPQFNRNAPEEVDKPFAPAAPPPSRIERQVAPPLVRPRRESPPLEPPATPIAPLERVVPPLAPPPADAAEPTPRETPIAPAIPVEPVTPPVVERDRVPAAEEPAARKAPVEAAPAPERSAPRIEREPAAPLPQRTPGETAPRLERSAPPATVPSSAPAAPAPARVDAPSGEAPPRLRFGAPDPGNETFKPGRDAVVPSSEPRGVPRIDLEATRQRAREIASEASAYRGVVPLAVPPPPDRKSKLAESIEKALKPDCRDAYAGMGLLAVPALIASVGGNGGCRW